MNKKTKVLIIILILFAGYEAWGIYYLLNTEERIVPLNSKNFIEVGDNFVQATGTWMSDTELAYPINNIEIICLRDSMLCIEARGEISENNLLVSQDIYDIDTWNEKEITTKPVISTFGCTQYSMRFDRVQETVTATRTTLSNEGDCEGADTKPLHLYLGRGLDAWLREKRKAK